ncbi:amidohydrolase family protein [Pseudonocardia sp. KRD-182]|uniref:amidohydrolase n=1 Tax=Pseudonocardia oceani TaxID=2792013 RepID=UPI001C4A74F9|nr:amidohydrolase family protein [Pseudonocardia oceani]MBW0111929.1 amidohydrolase family protein [Pseudonocardia oceani]
MTRTLLLGARVLDPGAPPGPAAVEIVDGTITQVRPAHEARGTTGGGTDDQVLRLDGALITPAFVDAHVHATSTGLLVDGLDLAGCPSPRALLDAVRDRSTARPGALVWGHGWQEQTWGAPPPTRAELDRAAQGAPVYLSRIDVHSALVSSDLAPSGAPDGPLSADAHHHARRAALAAVDPSVRDAAQRAFLEAAAARGVGVVHECAGPDISSRADLAALLARAAAGQGPDVVGYWGEAVTTADQARDLLAATGAHGLAGDLFVDGSIGSRTAALAAPYTDAPGCTGNRYLDAGQVAAHVAACTAAGVQAGFHVIGDAAAQILVDGLRRARTSAAGPVRHRVEHLEMVDAGQIAVLAAHGVVASVQPLFDACWGGPHGMYAQRLGSRAAAMNPFAALHAAGVALALGSDSPVTPVGPWEAVRAAVAHRTPGSGLTQAQAVAAHTVGGHRAAGDTDPLAGRILPGAPAGYAVWDGSVLGTGTDTDGRTDACLRTVQRGRVLHDTLLTGRAPAVAPFRA